MKERIKELEEKIRLARTQNSAVSENINETGHFLLGSRLTLLVMTLTGTYVGLKKASTQDFIPISSIEITES